MSIYYLPSLQPIEFAQFRALCNGGLAETFDAWALALSGKRRGLVAGGHHVIGVPVRPAQFRHHCRTTNCAPDAVALDVLATRIGTGIYDSEAAYRRDRARIVVVEETRSGQPVPSVSAARWHWWGSWRWPRFFGRRRALAVQPGE
jgi:hypothetical protein